MIAPNYCPKYTEEIRAKIREILNNSNFQELKVSNILALISEVYEKGTKELTRTIEELQHER